MKYYYRFWTIAAILLSMVACSENTEDQDLGTFAPDALINVTATPGIGQITFTWTNPVYYSYAELTYVTSDEQDVKILIQDKTTDGTGGGGLTTYVLGGFEDSNTYSFSLTPFGPTRDAGPSTIINCAPLLEIPEQISNITTTPGEESITFRWKNTVSYDHAEVEYEVTGGKKVKLTVPKDSVDTELGNGYTRFTVKGITDKRSTGYTFTPFGITGKPGPVTTVYAAPLRDGGLFDDLPDRIALEPVLEGVLLSWTSGWWDVPDKLIVSFVDISGEKVTKEVELTSDRGSVELTVFAEETELTIIAVSSKGEVSAPYVVKAVPGQGEIPVSRISAIEVDSQYQSYYPKFMLDRVTTTYWHSMNSSELHYATFDLGALYKINAAEIVRRLDRNDNGNGGKFWITHVAVYVSSDNNDYKKVYDDDFEFRYKYGHILNFTQGEICRYIKVELTSTMLYTHIAEFCAYFHDDPASISPFAELAAEERQ